MIVILKNWIFYFLEVPKYSLVLPNHNQKLLMA